MKKLFCILLASVLLLSAAGCSSGTESPSTASQPVNITVWTYYNGDTLAAFEALVAKFNETAGKEKGIFVSTFSYGSVDELEAGVLDSAYGEAGADDMPDIFMAYADTAHTMNQMGLLVNIADYMSEEELSLYVDCYIREGDLAGTGELKIFPAAKSTEIFCMNKTDWDAFASATGASLDSLATMEGLMSTAQAYYEWTDSLTAAPNDGKAFFGYDAMDNYFLIGAMQLGTEIFQCSEGRGIIDFNKETVRKLWDCFYVPFVKGYYSASGRFRSDDVKTGNAISYVGSSASATYFPNRVIVSDTESYPIEMLSLPCPQFENGSRVAVQQGAGMAIIKSTDSHIKASVEFLKWFTAPENNTAFSVNSGYLPVTYEGSTMEAILSSDAQISSSMEQAISAAITTVNECRLYTPRAFKGGTQARNVLKYALTDRAAIDRAAVLAACADGSSMEQALAPYLSDDAFEQWYTETKRLLQECVQ